MTRLLFAATLVSSLVAGAAAVAANPPAAQTAKTPTYAAPVIADANAMKGADEMQHTNLRQQLQDKLSKAGFTDIKVMPSSFYVQAKDKKGDPVAMVIGPDSFTEVTEIPQSSPAHPNAQSSQNSAQSQPSTSGTAKQP
jgi:hypothetical protein